MRASKDRKGSSGKGTNRRTNGDDLKRAVNWILNDRIFRDLKLHGNVGWTAVALVRLAVFWVWSSESSVVAAATEAIGKVTTIFGSAAVGSYQALTGALKTYTSQLLRVGFEWVITRRPPRDRGRYMARTSHWQRRVYPLRRISISNDDPRTNR